VKSRNNKDRPYEGGYMAVIQNLGRISKERAHRDFANREFESHVDKRSDSRDC
jgi:hypothetical protein